MTRHDQQRNDQRGDRPADDLVEGDGRQIDPEPLDPEPLAIDSDDVNEFVDRYGDDDRTVDTDAPPI